MRGRAARCTMRTAASPAQRPPMTSPAAGVPPPLSQVSHSSAGSGGASGAMTVVDFNRIEFDTQELGAGAFGKVGDLGRQRAAASPLLYCHCTARGVPPPGGGSSQTRAKMLLPGSVLHPACSK